ncbi:hypothetical protein [Streptomyces sp. NPDC054863]
MQRTTRQTPIRTQLPTRFPTPTVAQCTYGAMTSVFSTVAMLLLSQTTSGAWIAVIACAALGLGLLVAMTVPMPLAKSARITRIAKKAARGDRTRTVPTAASPAAASPETYDGIRVPGPRARSSVSSASSVGEHSLHG